MAIMPVKKQVDTDLDGSSSDSNSRAKKKIQKIVTNKKQKNGRISEGGRGSGAKGKATGDALERTQSLLAEVRVAELRGRWFVGKSAKALVVGLARLIELS